MRYRIDMSYDGAGFCGWQIQPSDPSVQEALEKALGTLLRARVQVTGAGRTDTGVSASFYVAHFDFDGPVPAPLAPGSSADNADSTLLNCIQLRFKLNAILPKSVSIIRITPVAPDFHARFSARRRQYTYFLHRVKDPFCERYSYCYLFPELDFEAMNRAAQSLLGTHDFSCFEKSGGDNKTSVCTVFNARWEPYRPVVCASAPLSGAPQFFPPSGDTRSHEPDATPREAPYWRFTIEADRFLRNMVRAIVGTLLEVGRGRRSIDCFASLVLPVVPVASQPAPTSAGPDGTLSSDNRTSRRSDAGESVPGHALFLSGIEY